MSGLSLETCRSPLKSAALTVLELLAFNAQKFRGHVTLATPPFRKFLRVHVLAVPGNMHVKFEDCSIPSHHNIQQRCNGTLRGTTILCDNGLNA